MKSNLIVFGFIINYYFGEIFNTVELSPTQSTTIVNGTLVTYRPCLSGGRQEFRVCDRFTGNLLQSTSYCAAIPITGMMNELFDYKFLNGPGSVDLSNTTFMFGSIRYQYLDKLKTTVNSRFSLFTGFNENNMKQGDSYMTEPSFPTFPDIDYSVSLIGDPDITKPSSDANLYVLGGAKYFQFNRTLSMVKNFSVYNFMTNIWQDLSDNLPTGLQQIAGHEMVNIHNKNFVVLGGYKTNNYSFDTGLSAINPEFADFSNLFIYNIEKNKWESKTASISQQDKMILSLRKQYSCTAVHRNNVLYAYAGFYIDPKTSCIVHIFGILDFKSWSWKWKQVQTSDSSHENQKNTHFDSILLENYMIVSQFNVSSPAPVKFVPFDLNIEEINTYIDYNPTDFSKPPLPKHYKYFSQDFVPVPFGVDFIIGTVAALAVFIIIFLLYRYIKHTRKKKDNLKFETKEVWSDPKYFKQLNNSIIFSHSNINMNYQGSIIEHFDTNMTMNTPYLEQTIESNWERNTLLTRQLFDSHTNSFQTSGTSMHQRGKPYNGTVKDTETTDNWDAYSTY